MRVLKLLVLALAVVSFAACGSKKKDDEKDPQTSEKPTGGGGDTSGGGQGDGNGDGDNGGDAGSAKVVASVTVKIKINDDGKTITVLESKNDTKPYEVQGKMLPCFVGFEQDSVITYELKTEGEEDLLSFQRGNEEPEMMKRAKVENGTVLGTWNSSHEDDNIKVSGELVVEQESLKATATCEAKKKEKPEGEQQQ